jgi:Xaa-Pro aminopeptidase
MNHLNAANNSFHQELFRRVQLARDLMEKMSLDALLLFTGPNLFYFTGMPCGRSGSRPFIYLLPRKGEPVLIVHDGRQFETHNFTAIQDIRTYTRLSHLPLDQLIAAIQDNNLLNKRIGVELGGEMVLDLPMLEYQSLTSALAQAEFVDASPLLWKMRMIKSPYEVAQIARACEITSCAYERTFKVARAGMSEAEIESLMYYQLLKSGGSAPWVLITSGAGNYDLVSKGSSSRVLETGDLVWMDVGCAVNGYWSDFSRAGVIGHPSQMQAEAQRGIYEITRIGVNMVRDGVAVSEIGQRCNEAIVALDLPVTSNISGLAARVGHGLGLVVTELPSLNESDTTILEPGMVITIEPGVATKYGTFHIEQNLVVTRNGSHVLSIANWELSSIKASR